MTRATALERATHEHASGIAGIVHALGAENAGLPEGLDRAGIEAWLDRLEERGAIVVALDGSIPIAFGSLDTVSDEPETGVLGVWVLPDHRRRGIATDLAEALLEIARDQGFRRIRGRLPEGNEPALSFLSAIGAMVPLRNPSMTFELPL